MVFAHTSSVALHVPARDATATEDFLARTHAEAVDAFLCLDVAAVRFQQTGIWSGVLHVRLYAFSVL